MINSQQENTEFKREQKLDFAIETMLVVVVLGSLMTVLLMTIFITGCSSFSRCLLQFMGNTFLSLVYALPGMLIFGFTFRIVIYLLDVFKLNPQTRTVLTIIFGLVIVIFTENLFLDFNLLLTNGEFVKSLIYVVSYGSPLIAWTYYRSIWESTEKYKNEYSELLDNDTKN